MAWRIFLENKQVHVEPGFPPPVPAGHLYLVCRDVEVDENGTVVPESNDYHDLDQILQAAKDENGELDVQIGDIGGSRDAYPGLDSIEGRSSTDILAELDLSWSELEQIALDIDATTMCCATRFRWFRGFRRRRWRWVPAFAGTSGLGAAADFGEQ